MKGDFWKKDIWQPPRFIGYKVLAVLLAVAVWVYVTITQNPLEEATFTVPVEPRGLSEALAQQETNYQVQVRVQGTASVINDLSSRDFTAYIDLTGMQAGEASPRVQIDLPENVTLVSQSPESIDLTLEPKISQTFAVEARVSGAPAENYTALSDDAVLSPQEVTLSSTAGYISEVGSVIVSADISGLETSYNRNLPVEVLDRSGNNITRYFTITPSSVNTVVGVLYEQPEATVAVRANTLGAPALGYQVSNVIVEPAVVRAFGDLGVLNSLYYLETEPIDISGLERTTSFTVNVNHDNSVSLAQDTVTVTVRIEPVASATFSRNLLHVQNVADGLACELPTTVIEVVVTGPDTSIQDLEEARVVPYVDCIGITEPGEYELAVAFSLPANVTLLSATPSTVTVTIVEAAPAEDGAAEEGGGETEEPGETPGGTEPPAGNSGEAGA